jgi:hypothetical protein
MWYFKTVPGWAGPRRRFFSFWLRASPFSYPRKPPSRSSLPNR